MRSLKLTVAYDGTNYVGWQVQPNGISIQQRLEEAWQKSTQESLRIIASGRTDSGVHALGQVCSVKTRSHMSCETIKRALNAHSPDDISVVSVESAPNDFHAIRDATSKTYRYQIQFGRVRNPLAINDHWFCPFPIDVAAVQLAAEKLVGELDFASFQAAGSERNSTVRNLTKLDCSLIERENFSYLHFEMTSNGFLYNMVRNIAGTLIRVGQGGQPPEWVDDVIARRDRSFAGPTAPAHGLVMVKVEYDGIVFGSASN